MLSPDDQLYVYEAAAMLVMGGDLDKAAYMSQLLTPVLDTVHQLGQLLTRQAAVPEQQVTPQLGIIKYFIKLSYVTLKTVAGLVG